MKKYKKILEELKEKEQKIKKMSFKEKEEILKKVIELSQNSVADGDCDYTYLSFKLGTSDITFFSKYDYSIEKDEIIEGTDRAEDWICLINSLQIEENYYSESYLILTDSFEIPNTGTYSFREIEKENVEKEIKNSDYILQKFKKKKTLTDIFPENNFEKATSIFEKEAKIVVLKEEKDKIKYILVEEK